MYQHLEIEKKRHFTCASCHEHPVSERGGVCGLCSNSVAEWSAEADNPAPTTTASSTVLLTPDPTDDPDEEGDDQDITAIVRKKRISYRDDFELVILRHSELRRAFAACPDLNSRLWAADPEIRKAVKSSWGKMRYRPVMSMFGVAEGDLHILMLAWSAIYIGLYEKRPEKIKDENKKLLAVHLRQKFVEFIGTLYKKMRDCVPDREVGIGFSLSSASVSMGRPFDLPAKAVGASPDSRPQVGAANADQSYRRRHIKLRTGTEAERRRDAKRLLEEGLAALAGVPTENDQAEEKVGPCEACKGGKKSDSCQVCKGTGKTVKKPATHGGRRDKLAQLLEEGVANERFCPDAKRQAKKLLEKVEACTTEDPCSVCVTRNRPMDKAVLGYPQANSLPLTRAYVLSLIKGQRPFVEALGVVSPESLSRHTAYYRHAARALGFAAENRDGSTSPTKYAFDLAQTEPGSEEERALFLQQATTAPSLKDVAWFFDTIPTLIEGDDELAVEVPASELAEIIVQEKSRRPGFDHVNPATAERRVSTLVQWKTYIMGDEPYIKIDYPGDSATAA